MSIVKKLISHTAVYGLSSIVGRLLSYFLVPIYTAYFLPEQYGVVTELYAYVAFLVVLLTFGMETAYFRYAKDERFTERQVFSTLQAFLIGLSLLFLVVSYLFFPSILRFLDYGSHPDYVQILLFIVVIDAITAIPFARLRFFNQAKKFAIVRLSSIFLNVFLNLFLIVALPKLSALHFFNFNFTPDILFIFVSNILASAFTVLLLLRHFRDLYTVNFKLLRASLIYSLPLVVMGIAGMVNETFDRIILKHLVVVPDSILDKSAYLMHELGIYGANYKLSIFMSLFIQAYRYAAEPVFFSLSGEQDAKVQYAHVMNYFFAFVVFIFLLITLYIDFFKHFISSSYHAGLVVVPILLAANLCLGLIYNLSIWYKVIDKTKFGMYTGLFGAGLTIVLNFLLIPSMGYLGAAWATLICYFLMLCVSYYLSRIYYRIDYNFRKLGLLFLSGSLVYLFDFFLRSTDLSFVVSSVLRTFAFFGYLFVALFVLDLNRRLKWKLKL